MKPKVLICDDERGICAALSIAMEGDYSVQCAYCAADALELVKSVGFELVLLDLRIGVDDGLLVLDKIKAWSPDTVVIIMTAYGSIQSSVEAMKRGAYSYLTKPVDLEELSLVMKQAEEFHRLNRKVAALSNELSSRYRYAEMIGKSSAMQNIYHIIDRVKDSDVSVVITGESGTGKELAARAAHFMGRRKDEAFVEVNCAAIPEGLLEEELFGHKRGSFTGATADRTGKFAQADGGTIFLDEIGDLPLNLQGKLLRVLQQKEFSPIGSNEKLKIDVRVIAATNRPIEQMVQEGTFREDLYYRLNVVNIQMPPLRERKQDIPLLCKCFLESINSQENRNVQGFSREAEQILLEYDYPGNVRELINIVEYAALFTAGDTITEKDLPGSIHRKRAWDCSDLENMAGEKGMTLRQLEKAAIISALQHYKGKRKLVADALGISERGLRNKINEYGIEG